MYEGLNVSCHGCSDHCACVASTIEPTYAGLQPNQTPYSDALRIYNLYAFDMHVVCAPMHIHATIDPCSHIST